ncbi:hypothetical protein G7Y79_00025g056980 [Physcia stellaris]|nr:hypothetical protein G7Y79_00025g056980 [Physcia stellaris]
MSHYPQYQQQPPVLQPGPGTYAPSPTAYSQQYGYSNGVTSPQSAGHPVPSSMGPQMNSGMLPLPAMGPGGPPPHPYGGALGPAQGYPQPMNDTTGQVAPPGMKPRVTATLWEDEGSMCFQVEAKGVCVARRDDNHMINGTKLLNVAGMTRGRRDGILKSEKMRHVVKIGPMHLKGVWIPFERALDFANKEKITELLYPLFVHNIGALLYHPTNSNRTNAVMAAAERRKLETKQQQGMVGAPGSQPPSLHHHHSMNSASAPQMSQPPHSIAPHPGAGRPALDRAHTFPTPPTSASSGIGMGGSGSSYDWSAQSISNNVPGAQPLSIDTHPHSTPNTPATTPPGPQMGSMHSYPNQQAYENSRPLYSAPAAPQGQYAAQQNVQHASNNYMKHEMGPPSGRALGSGREGEHPDQKNDAYSHGQSNNSGPHGTGEEEADHENDTDYPHDTNAAYNSNRGSYSYNPGPNLGSLHGEHGQISPEMNGSPTHPNGSGRMTPRNSAGSQSQWTSGYHSPPRAAPSSNLYNVMSDTRSSVSNGTAGTEAYSSSTCYAPSHVNGSTTSSKRLRDDDQDDHARTDSDDVNGLKRQKICRQGSIGGATTGTSYDRDGRPMNRARSNVVQRPHR